MYKDIVIKKRVWIEDETDLTIWDIFEDSEEVPQIESISTVNFNGRIPVEDGVIVGEWMTNGIQLIKADMGELLSGGEGKIQTLKPESIEKMLEVITIIPGKILPIGVYDNRGWNIAIRFSNGQEFADINIQYFQYIYEGGFDYELFSDGSGFNGLALKRDGLVCGAVMCMNLHNQDVIWERPYSLSDVEALNTIQGDPV